MDSWLMNGNTSCPNVVLDEVTKRLEREMWQVNGIMLLNAIIMGVVVFIGVCASRYRRHPTIGFIFNGANALFLPIVSFAASTGMTTSSNLIPALTWSETNYIINGYVVTVTCREGSRRVLVLVWTGLVLFVGISTSAVVAGDPREGRNIEPSSELLVKVIWVAYLVAGEMLTYLEFYVRFSVFLKNSSINLLYHLWIKPGIMFVVLVATSLSKICQKYRVFYKARGSFVFGRNPRLIVSYMAQIDTTRSQDTEQVERHVVPPPSLIVMEGGDITLEQQSRGYSFRSGTPGPGRQQIGVKTKKGSEMVTLDRVWGLDNTCFLSSTPQAKDLCFSFALFKVLRCRFAKYTVSEAGFTKARNFFWHKYAQSDDYKRVFRVIADELSFFHDYYYCSMSIPFLHCQFLFTRVLNQIFFIGFVLYIFVSIKQSGPLGSAEQIQYDVRCGVIGTGTAINFGHRYFDEVPIYFVLVAILVSEIRETASYLCSNFTKVVLICNYVRKTRRPKFVAFVFKYLRCEWLLNNWDDKMSQCKLLVFHPWEVSVLFRRLIRLPDQKKIKVPSEVKESIFKALQGLAREHEGQGDLKHIRFPLSPISDSVDARSACGGKGVVDTILAWHITTSIFEVKQQQLTEHLLGCKTAAVRLSQYCAYLVCYRLELLPDDVEWCKTLRQAVKKEAARILANKRAATPAAGEDQFQHLVHSFSTESKHEVLRNSARLAQELVDSGKGWEALARLWSEMILYIAPSEKLDEHAEAISRGGELVTLVWALLAHAGIVDRLDAADAPAATCDADGRV